MKINFRFFNLITNPVKRFAAIILSNRAGLSISKLIILVVCLLITYVQYAASQPAASYKRSIDKLLAESAKSKTPFNGIILIGNKNKVLYQRTAGFANFELNVPITEDNRFRIASVSKQFAGLLAVLLAGEEILDLNAPVEKYLPVLKDSPAGAVTLRQILTHTSGLPNDRPYLWDHVTNEYKWDWRKNRVMDSFSSETFLKEIAKEKYGFTPGSSFSYSNEAYVLAGLTMAAAAGDTYENLLKKYILIPLNMQNSGVERIDSLIEKKAYNYEWADGKPFPIARFRNLYPIGPAGAMYSTTEDMHKWAKAVFYSDETLSKKSREHFYPQEEGYLYGIMRSRLAIKKGQKINFAFRRNSTENSEELKDFIWHNGQIAGTFALIGFLPARKIHLIVLSNVGFTFPQQDFMTAVLMSVEGLD